MIKNKKHDYSNLTDQREIFYAAFNESERECAEEDRKYEEELAEKSFKETFYNSNNLKKSHSLHLWNKLF